MNPELASKAVPVALGVAAALLLVQWTQARSRTALELRVPGTDRLGMTQAPAQVTDLRGDLRNGPGVAVDLPGLWPNFRGPNLDNISLEAAPGAWSASGPAHLWRVDLGEGYAGPAVRNGRVYLLDYDQQNRADVLRCWSLADGREIWARSYAVEVKRNHGMSRTVPAVTDDYVVTLGPKCHVSCADARTGEFRWGIDLAAQYKTRVPPWYAGQCPLIEDERVILAPAGEVLMMAVALSSGTVVWKTPNPRQWDMTHSSIIPMDFAGRRTYVYCGSGGVVGVSADDGAILWETTQWKVSMATVPAPLVIGSDRILLTGGYGAGSLMLKLAMDGQTIVPEVLYRLPPEVFGSEQQTPVYHKGLVYGVIPGGQLVCLHPDDGRTIWSSGTQRFGIGPYMINADLIYLVNDKGTLTVAQTGSEGYRELGQWLVIENAHESWGPLALAGGRLLVRDLRQMVCVNLMESEP